MLVLSRKKNEGLVITTENGQRVQVVLFDIRGESVRLGIEAPETITIHRKEVQDAIDRER